VLDHQTASAFHQISVRARARVRAAPGRVVLARGLDAKQRVDVGGRDWLDVHLSDAHAQRARAGGQVVQADRLHGAGRAVRVRFDEAPSLGTVDGLLADGAGEGDNLRRTGRGRAIRHALSARA
jgi:hypothetical protein